MPPACCICANFCSCLSAAVKCTAMQEVMRDPILASDGHTYERYAITDWLCNNGTSPNTGLCLVSKDLAPNYALRSAIAASRWAVAL